MISEVLEEKFAQSQYGVSLCLGNGIYESQRQTEEGPVDLELHPHINLALKNAEYTQLVLYDQFFNSHMVVDFIGTRKTPLIEVEEKETSELFADELADRIQLFDTLDQQAQSVYDMYEILLTTETNSDLSMQARLQKEYIGFTEDHFIGKFWLRSAKEDPDFDMTTDENPVTLDYHTCRQIAWAKIAYAAATTVGLLEKDQVYFENPYWHVKELCTMIGTLASEGQITAEQNLELVTAQLSGPITLKN